MELATQTGGGGRGLIPTDFETELFDDQPRIPDWKLARALGFANERQIRELIERHRATLERAGILSHRTTVSARGPAGRECRLNFKQAIIIVTQSQAPNAIEVLLHVVTIYELWARGDLVPRNTATAIAIAASVDQVQQATPELWDMLSSHFAELQSQVADLTAHTKANDQEGRARLESLQRTVLEIQKSIPEHAAQKRAKPAKDVIKKQEDTLIRHCDGYCPICKGVQILKASRDSNGAVIIQKSARYNYGHLRVRTLAGWFYSLPMCDDCNQNWEKKLIHYQWVWERVISYHRLLREDYGLGLTGTDGAMF